MPSSARDFVIRNGGPVDRSRGFVLHSDDYVVESSLPISEQICLTATVDILRAISVGRGPRRALMALGYSSWAPGQLDDALRVTCEPERDGRVSMRIRQRILRDDGSGEPLVIADVRVACLDARSLRPRRIPEFVPLAPRASAGSASSSETGTPRRASPRAIAVPTTPPPITQTVVRITGAAPAA